MEPPLPRSTNALFGGHLPLQRRAGRHLRQRPHDTRPRANIKYGNNYFYATTDSLRTLYYPAGSKGKKQATDIVSASTTDKKPVFVKLDTNPNSPTNTNDLHLQAGSPALGAGNVTYNKDIGAYTSDGNGNKH